MMNQKKGLKMMIGRFEKYEKVGAENERIEEQSDSVKRGGRVEM